MRLLILFMTISYVLSFECTKTSTGYECFLKALETLELDKKILEDAKRDIEIKMVELQKANDALRNEMSSLRNNTNISIIDLSSLISSTFSNFDHTVSNQFLQLNSNLTNVENTLNGRVDALSHVIHNHECRQIATDCKDDGGGNSVYLDRHTLSCTGNEFLRSWRLNRCTSNTIQILAECCHII